MIKETAEEFNQRVAIGTRVRFWPISSRRENFIDSKTRSEAWELGSGDVVVAIEGKSGGVSIEPQFLQVITK